MSTTHDYAQTPATAVVARPGARESYLQFSPLGQPTWTTALEDAATFGSMREAARAAFRLPASLRAYGLPRSVELALSRTA